MNLWFYVSGNPKNPIETGMKKFDFTSKISNSKRDQPVKSIPFFITHSHTLLCYDIQILAFQQLYFI